MMPQEQHEGIYEAAAALAAGQAPLSRPHAAKSHILHRAPPAGMTPARRCSRRGFVGSLIRRSDSPVSVARSIAESLPMWRAIAPSRAMRTRWATLAPAAVRTGERDRASRVGILVTYPALTRRSTRRTVPEWVRPMT